MRPTSVRSSEAPAEPGGAEGQTGELQAGGGLFGRGGHELERIGAHGGVALVLQHFEAVDDGADRADQIVADAADQERGEFDIIHGFHFPGFHAGRLLWFASGDCRVPALRKD